MIFLDSWVWLEYLCSGATDEAAEAAIERANTADEGGLIAPTGSKPRLRTSPTLNERPR
ncbi:hypothetical protein [Haloplanus natans]|uniref:hypothetical protein n=1 Tax=Haloplanus natans TaxID=376171 RepID=UPI0012FA8D8A|nr:hypothetical protein [Haloplanus natans]